MTDGPTITVRLFHGHLVPASPFDREVVAGSWRDGATLAVKLVSADVRPLERKYWAILSALMKGYKTPWPDEESAHRALKAEAGFVTPLRRKDGKWDSRERRLATFTDRELQEYFDIFCGTIRKRFGIDAEELRRDSSETESESSDAAVQSPAVDDAPGTGPIPAGVGQPSSATTYPPVADGPEAGGALDLIPRDALSAEGPKLTNEEWDWLKVAARMLVSSTAPGGDTGIVDRQVLAIKQFLTPGTISQKAKDKAQAIYRHCRAVTRNEVPLDRKWVATVAGCTVDDLRPEAR